MILNPQKVYELLGENGISTFAGVPDSLLKDFCAYVSDHSDAQSHFITANEGNAVALASGIYLGSGRSTLVYLQNSGLGNILNPLLSLAHRDIYSIPMLLMIGWRGEPGVSDEPQHLHQGLVTCDLLEAAGIEYFCIGPDTSEGEQTIVKAIEQMNRTQSPVALVIRRGTFSSYKSKREPDVAYSMSREEAISTIVNEIGADDLVISTTGMTSRELFEYRAQQGMDHSKDFMSVGSMGHVSSIALGVAIACKEKRIVCLDGDGSMLMHLGATAIIGMSKANNLIHIVLNNGAHDSVGGQPTVAYRVGLTEVARQCGYHVFERVENIKELKSRLQDMPSSNDRPAFLEVFVRKGARKDLGRPTTSPLENRDSFMNTCLQ